MSKTILKPDYILLAGVPRSGSSWTARVLAQSPGTILVREPDNEKNYRPAQRAKHNLHRFPYIPRDHDNRDFHLFWQKVFEKDLSPSNPLFAKLYRIGSDLLSKTTGKHYAFKCRDFHPSGNMNEKTRIIKSVHAGLSLPYLNENFRPKILIIFRHPASIVASCLRLKLPDGNREVFRQTALVTDFLEPYMSTIETLSDPLALMGLQVAIFYHVWERQMDQYPQWITTTHEDLCEESASKFRRLYDQLGLPWRDEIAAYIDRHNTGGGGYEIRRVASQVVDQWKTELSAQQIRSVRQGYGILPVRHYHEFQTGN